MATLATLNTRLQRRVIDIPAAVSAEVNTLLLEKHREIQEVYSFKVMEAVEARSTTAGDPSLGTIGLPNFKDYRGRPWFTDDLGHTYFLTVVHSESEVRRAFNQDADLGPGRPRVLLHRAPDTAGDTIDLHEWRVFPVPDGLAQTADGEYAIEIPHYAYLPEPSTSDWITDNAEEFLLEGATAEAFALNWDEVRYAFWRQKAYGPLWDSRGVMGGSLLRAIQRDKRFRVSAVDTIVPYPGGDSFKMRL